MNEREQFEAHCIRVYGRGGALLERDVNGEYIDAAVWSGWQWWQARADLARAEVEELRKLMQKARFVIKTGVDGMTVGPILRETGAMKLLATIDAALAKEQSNG